MQGKVLQRARARDLAHGRRHEGRFEPLGWKHAHARLGLVADLVEHAADQRGGVDRWRVGPSTAHGHPVGGVPVGRRDARMPGIEPRLRGVVRALRRRLPHEKAAVLARLHQPLRQQLVVGGHHGGWAHVVLQRALAHRGQARTGRHQPVADALGKTRRQLLGQGLRGRLHQHGGASWGRVCTVTTNHTVGRLHWLTVLVVYCFERLH